MRIGIITDAHANLPALQAVLQIFRAEECDLIVHTGDAVGIGPHPREVVETLLTLDNAILLQGNHDEYAVQGPNHRHFTFMQSGEKEHQAWVRAQLPDELIAELSRWPHTHRIETGSGELFFCHYARTAGGSDFAPILRNAEPAEFDRLFGRMPPGFVFHGHEHPTALVHGECTYVDPGALGVWGFPSAPYAILTSSEEDLPDIRLETVPYDGDIVLRDLEIRQVPARELIRRSFYRIG